MKTKKILSIIFIALISVILLPFTINAENISTLNVKNNNNKLTISGTTENGVLATAVLVYSGNDLSHMESCSVNNNTYNCELSKIFDRGSYTVKVADYDGGEYITKDVTISTQQSDTSTNPGTFDGITSYIGIGLLSVLGLASTCLYIKKKY